MTDINLHFMFEMLNNDIILNIYNDLKTNYEQLGFFNKSNESEFINVIIDNIQFSNMDHDDTSYINYETDS